MKGVWQLRQPTGKIHCFPQNLSNQTASDRFDRFGGEKPPKIHFTVMLKPAVAVPVV